jgi:hypothetical protein
MKDFEQHPSQVQVYASSLYCYDERQRTVHKVTQKFANVARSLLLNILSRVLKSLQSGFLAIFRFLKDKIGFGWIKKPNAWKGILAMLLFLAILLYGAAFYWSYEPRVFDVRQNAQQHAQGNGHSLVIGYTTSATLIEVIETMLTKPGGYMSNDILPPFVWMDNIPSWEFGVLVQSRDMARAMRTDFCRSRSQSIENPQLAIAEPALNYDHNSWIFPASEDKYRDAQDELNAFIGDLSRQSRADTQFYARADNLADWLAQVEKRLGSMSQRLAAARSQTRINTDLSGDPAAQQATLGTSTVRAKTPWLQIDNVFYEARGTAWALIHFLRAVEIDFAEVLKDKNALTLLQQIIVELEQTQATLWSPLVLNGSGFGMTANHSLVMASYISRANASIIELRSLLSDG